MKRTHLGVFEMANKPTQPVFPLGLAAEKQSTLAGVLNTGTIEHGPDAVLTLPEGNASAGLPSSVRYNADSDEFEGFYENGGWLPLGGGGIRWEVLPYASTATLTEGRGYLINNTTGTSTVVLPSPTRIGESVTICDAYGKFGTYPLTVSPSGNNLYGSTEDMAITTDNVSATFTWSGPEQGWIITSGVGLGQGRVYSREIFTKILASETSSVALNTPPTIVDVYADGKRLAESKYSLDGNVITFSPSLPANTELQVIEYTPIQLGNGGGSSSSTITWVYNGGSAIGGETEITLDVVVDDVPAIDINGSRQYKNLGFTFDPLTSKITLAQELEPEDEVVVIINGTPNIYNQIDHTLREVARVTNVKDTEVVYFSVGAALSGYKVIYDKETQRAYPLPADIVPGTTAVSLSSSAILVHSAGSVDLGELAVSREEYVTLSGSFDTGVTVNTKNELVVFTDGKYRWDGVLPKEVSAGSTPEASGGIGDGKWVGVGDASLRYELSLSNGSSLIGVNSEMSLSDFYSSFETVTIKNGDTLTPFSDRVSLRVFAKGGDFPNFTIFPVVPKVRTINPSTPSGLVSNLNLTSKPYSVTIGGTDYWLLDVDHFNPSKPSLRAFWAEEGESAPACDASISALLGSFGDCYLDSGVFNFTKTISVPGFTRVTGAGDTNAIGYSGYFRTTQLWYNPASDDDEPAMTLAENGSDSYSVSLADFSIRAINSAVNKNTGITRRTTGSQASDFLSRVAINRVSVYGFGSGIVLDHVWLLDMSRVMSQGLIGLNATGVGICIKQATSMNIRSCFVLGFREGWRVFGTYSSLYNCGADQQSYRAYTLGAGVVVNNCGSESQLEGATIYTASGRWKDFSDSTLGTNPVVINNPNGLQSVSAVTLFADENNDVSGCMVVNGGEITVGDGVTVAKCNGSSKYPTYMKLNKVSQRVLLSSGVFGSRDFSYLSKKIVKGTNASNMTLLFNNDATVISKTTSGGSSVESFICIKVPRNQVIQLQTSPRTFGDKTNSEKLTVDIEFSSEDNKVIQSKALKGSDRIMVGYYESNTDIDSIFLLLTYRDIPNGRSVLVKMNKGSGYPVDPVIATSGTKLTPVVMS